MVNQILVTIVNSVLGTGKPTSKGNYAYHCPFCKHSKLKLEINFTENTKGENPWHCWTCNARGKKLTQLFKAANAPHDKILELKPYLKTDVTINPNIIQNEKVSLPKEFISLINPPSTIMSKHALVYIKKRGVTLEDVIKYNLGYCEEGKYMNHIIIPSYDENGTLNYFTARSFEKDSKSKKNPTVSRDIIPFGFFINWDLPLILCEGPFDAISIKRNAIPLLGKQIQPNLMKKIVMSSVSKIYIALDKDAQKQALDFCEKLMNEGKEVYLINMEDKDPSEMGFKNFTNLIQNTNPLTFSNLLSKKFTL
jgi:hypothetical protein